MANFHKGEVWFVEFPYEDNPSITGNRPVIVLDENTLGVLSVKITRHPVRKDDPYDTPILYWAQAGLRFASTARVSKVMNLRPEDFMKLLGCLHPEDLNTIEELYVKYMIEKEAEQK